MSTTYNHIRMSTVDASNNVAVLYPETTASDVSVSRTNNANIPQSATNIQLLANALATSAFTNPISDSTTSSTSTWSSTKINTALTNVSVYVDSTDGKLHFVNSAGTDSALNFNKASGTATADKVLTGFTFSNSSGIDIPGSMVNNGAISQTVNPGSSYTIPEGYHNGNGVVTANTVENTLTYTFASGSTGATVDLGANNTYRYVNAANVYAQGQADGATTHTGTFTVNTTGTLDMGEIHTYRYVETDGLSEPETILVSVGDEVYGSITTVSGYTNTDTSSYKFRVIYYNDGIVVLLGLSSLYVQVWSVAMGFRWDVSFAAYTISNKPKTILRCRIPLTTYFNKASDPVRDNKLRYWFQDEYSYTSSGQAYVSVPDNPYDNWTNYSTTTTDDKGNSNYCILPMVYIYY